jgi:hypothetical protein
MPADEAETPEPRGADGVGSRLGQAVTASRVGLGGASRAIKSPVFTRFCKYVVLIGWVVLTLLVVFDAYSFYVARREIDAELRSKRVSSLEYLGVLSQRKRALAITALEGRCMERTQLTMFRIFDAQQEEIKAAYGEMMKAKDKMVKLVEESGPGLIDAKEAEHFINLQGFTLLSLVTTSSRSIRKPRRAPNTRNSRRTSSSCGMSTPRRHWPTRPFVPKLNN